MAGLEQSNLQLQVFPLADEHFGLFSAHFWPIGGVRFDEMAAYEETGRKYLLPPWRSCDFLTGRTLPSTSSGLFNRLETSVKFSRRHPNADRPIYGYCRGVKDC